MLRIYEPDPTIYDAGCQEILVEHPDLPLIYEGAVIPRVSPVMQMIGGVISMMDWGLPE